MAFPDDYRRWQVAGGNAAVVDSHIGLLRQLLVDTTALNIRLMDGVTPGGHKVVMDKDFAVALESKAPTGELAYIQDPDTNDPNPVNGQAPKRMWTSRVMRTVLEMLADMTDPNAWIVKNAAMPATLRQNALQTANLDEAVVSGFYRFVPNATAGLPGDLPSGSTDQYMMLVIRQSSAELTQIIFSRVADGKIWTRSRVAGTFQDWTLSTGVTTADLLNYVAKAGSTMTGKLTLATSTNILAGLRLLSGVSPSAPNDGDLWRDDAAGGIKYRKGGVTKSIVDDDVAATRDQRILYVRDQKAAGNAGASIAGVQVRVLNTVVLNRIPGASVVSNQITLPAGKYHVDARAPSLGSSQHQAWVRVAGGGAVLLAGSCQFGNPADNVMQDSTIKGELDFAATTTIELAHYTATARSPNGLGTNVASGSGTEIYAEMWIKKVD